MNKWVVVAGTLFLAMAAVGGYSLLRGGETKEELVAPQPTARAEVQATPIITASPSATVEASSDDSGMAPVQGNEVDEGEEVVE